MPYLLDTDTCVEVIRGREPATLRVKRHSPEDLLISAMTLAELRYGALNSSKPESRASSPLKPFCRRRSRSSPSKQRQHACMPRSAWP
jgi:predicted nucleic acid-binding protein